MPRRALVVVFIVAIAIVVGVGEAAINPPFSVGRASTSYTGTRITMTDNLTTFSEMAGNTDQPFDKLVWICHGGRAQITWYVGDLEPERPETGIHLSMLLDGKVISTLLVGSHDGDWNDHPASMLAAVACPAGVHVLTAQAEYTGSWNFPYANSNDAVERGFVVEEVWGPDD